jgi:hypothetical protein
MTDDSSRTVEETDQPQDAEADERDRGDEEETAERGADGQEQASQDGAEDDPETKAQQVQEETERAKEKVAELEDDPPAKLEDWPEDKAKYETFGGPEGEHGYHQGPETKLGPPDVRHKEDGGVEVRGEEADEPEEFKGEPVAGGPTDPNTPNLRMDKASPEDISDVAKRASEGEGEEQQGDEQEERD